MRAIGKLFLLLFVPTFVGAAASAGEVRWRMFEKGNQRHLVAADSDATDAIGPLRFDCSPGTKLVSVEVALDASQRKGVATLIADGSYPRIVTRPAGREDLKLPRISFSETDGWLLGFDVPTEAPALAAFTKTGAFQFDFAKIAFRFDGKAGLSDVAKFLSMC